MASAHAHPPCTKNWDEQSCLTRFLFARGIKLICRGRRGCSATRLCITGNRRRSNADGRNQSPTHILAQLCDGRRRARPRATPPGMRPDTRPCLARGRSRHEHHSLGWAHAAATSRDKPGSQPNALMPPRRSSQPRHFRNCRCQQQASRNVGNCSPWSASRKHPGRNLKGPCWQRRCVFAATSTTCAEALHRGPMHCCGAFLFLHRRAPARCRGRVAGSCARYPSRCVTRQPRAAKSSARQVTNDPRAVKTSAKITTPTPPVEGNLEGFVAGTGENGNLGRASPSLAQARLLNGTIAWSRPYRML